MYWHYGQYLATALQVVVSGDRGKVLQRSRDLRFRMRDPVTGKLEMPTCVFILSFLFLFEQVVFATVIDGLCG